MIDDLAKLADDVTAARRAVSELRGHADSADGLVTVTVDGDGRLIDLELDARIYRNADSVALAEQIKQTFDQAIEDATRQAIRLMRATILPRAGATTDLVLDPVLEQIRLRAERTS
ncbi:YbaB/EbfC DNA-binding family protein [Kribbella sp. VKM Ac-2527]|uniref:YbaB/EbfC DNA-binding family protein n=1 Tax=Kribbella caucasensis TaxID=2512215 RepID=A0A4R6KLG2_9ACTN|nr:YbaB/EbfC family nucleoid-associated protein [Kribbella sp. VKM Ac-2527]TDO50626.1 YbaB/EbfC DNA-binding family protein [Kribbella sp. VKM Ac-2527]